MAWRTYLDDFLAGKNSMTEEQATNHKVCDVGKWLYSVGMKKYGDLDEIQKLEKIHVELHATVKKVILLQEAGDIDAKKKELKKLDRILRKIMLLLVRIEENLILNRR